ncbi:MAG: cupredoxin domain-containing protein [Candidatus Paceibacterota bacterium]|jgi:plastocyanin
MTEKQKITLWVVIGLVGAAIIVYLGVRGGLNTTTVGGGVPTSSTPANEVTERPTGAPAQSIEVPKASEPINVGEIPSKAVKLSISSSGFSPSSFTIDAGDRVMIAITGDEFTHTFSFDNPSLSNFSVGVSAGQTRTIEFNAPGKGEYVFRCGLPNHAERGEVGKMIVK